MKLCGVVGEEGDDTINPDLDLRAASHPPLNRISTDCNKKALLLCPPQMVPSCDFWKLLALKTD